MNNSYENLPEEYENDGNTYCHGIVNCKYYHEGCNFMYMGSGDPDDMPCRVQEQNDLKAFLEWREKQEQAKELEERPQGDKLDYKVINRGKCMLCGKELTEGLFFCKECEQKGGAVNEEKRY